MATPFKFGSEFMVNTTGTGLSYDFLGSCAMKEPLHATPFMACSGVGWIDTGLVVMDRFRV